jgi:hypothetical protein
VGFGVGAAGLLVGVITGAVTLGQASDLKDQCPDDRCTEAQREDYDAALALSRVSTVSFVVGGLGAAVGLVALLVSGSDEPEETDSAHARRTRAPAVSLTPLVGPGMLGLMGQF